MYQTVCWLYSILDSRISWETSSPLKINADVGGWPVYFRISSSLEGSWRPSQIDKIMIDVSVTS